MLPKLDWLKYNEKGVLRNSHSVSRTLRTMLDISARQERRLRRKGAPEDRKHYRQMQITDREKRRVSLTAWLAAMRTEFMASQFDVPPRHRHYKLWKVNLLELGHTPNREEKRSKRTRKEKIRNIRERNGWRADGR